MTDASVKRPKVVVIGAGFGGIQAVHGLRHAAVDIILVDRNNHFLFQPLLYQVATAALAPTDVASPIRSMFAKQSNVTVLLDEAKAVDAASQKIRLHSIGELSYDILVLATGAQASWFGHTEWAKHSFGLKSLADANVLRQRLLGAFEAAERCHDPDAVSALLTFIVVGGGSSGVELAGSIRDLARLTLKHDFRNIDPDKARVLLFEAGPNLLAGFPERLVHYAEQRLSALGVELHIGVQVEEVRADGVVAAGTHFPAENIFWCAGVAANPAATWIDARTGKHGTVLVDQNCTVPGHENIFAIGDVASFGDETGKTLPGVAPVAKQQGAYVARVIAARVRGAAAPKTFKYRDQGSLAIVGRSSAVASLPHVKLTGFIAWIMWTCVHLVLLAGVRNRILVYVQWMSAWLFNARGARLMIGKSEADT